ncbi:MAG: DUF1033 family protein [Enterococcus sp.]
MYQVVMMYGDNEPWWFFEDWQQEIEAEVSFQTFEEAQKFYTKQWQQICTHYTYINAKPNFLCAFWNTEELRWCEECDDDLQQYKGIALLKDYQPVAIESRKELYETTNSSGKAKRCERPKQGAWS